MIAIVQALVLSFACVALLMPSYLRLLRHSGFGKRVRREFGPDWHIVKEGTPTMGGLLLVGVVIALALLLDAVDASTYAILLALLGVSLVGAFDDWLNARTGRRARRRRSAAGYRSRRSPRRQSARAASAERRSRSRFVH